jgi:hypothetical protein
MELYEEAEGHPKTDKSKRNILISLLKKNPKLVVKFEDSLQNVYAQKWTFDEFIESLAAEEIRGTKVNPFNFHNEPKKPQAPSVGLSGGKARMEMKAPPSVTTGDKDKKPVPMCTVEGCPKPVGHTADDCWTAHPEKRAEFLEKKKDRKEKNVLATVAPKISSFANMMSVVKEASKCIMCIQIVDTGATTTMTNRRELFDSLMTCQDVVYQADGVALPVRGIGTIRGIKGCYYIPEINFTLFLVVNYRYCSCYIIYFVKSFQLWFW